MGCGVSSRARVAQEPTSFQEPCNTQASSEVIPPNSAKTAEDDAGRWAPPEPEKEPASEPGSVPTHRREWARKEGQSQRIRRQRGEAVAPSGEIVRPAQPSEMSSENRRFLVKVLQRHFLFAGLEDDERSAVIEYMRMQKAQANEIIFRQGQKGDCCYIIQTGVYTVSIDNRNLKQLRSKHTFGELAMLYNVNRTATVTCNAEGLLWKMDGNCFRLCMDKLSERHTQRAMAFLNEDPSFSPMKEDEKRRLAHACSVQVFNRGEQILREGEVGDWMFIVIEGTVQTVDRYGNSTKKQQGTILGSAAMMYMKQQVCGAKAVDRVVCLALAKSALDRLFGSVEDVIRRSAIKAMLLDNNTASELSFFRNFTNVQQNTIIDKFELVNFKEGEVVVTKGAKAQLLLVIEGEVAILPDSAAEHANAAEIRVSAQKVLTSGMAYGGDAMIRNCEMDADVVALSKVVKLQRLGSQMVTEALGDTMGEVIRINELKKVLLDIFLFKNLPEEQVLRTARSLKQKVYKAGDTIVREGDESENFYLIHSGTVHVTKGEQQLRTLGRWDYFGERGLLTSERGRRSATCRAQETCICFSLEASVFADIVGNFRKELEHRMHLQDLGITMEDLRLQAVVGRGSFGIVKLVHHKDDKSKVYALKCVSKKQVVKQGQQKSMAIEREINAQCYHPCIMQFIKTFQDSKNVYFLTEFLGGGDLFYTIREIGHLTKEQAQWYGGSIALALEYLHGSSIMYRDLKPENVLLDFKGNAKLVDFGCCKQAMRTNTLVGTPEYFAPETILGKGYTCAIDWWALGVMMHEFVVGPLPFGRETEDQLELFREILEAPLQFPNYIVDTTAVSIISGLLERTPEMRLGASTRGAMEIREHQYFTGFNWDGPVGRHVKPPWTPNLQKLQANWELQEGEKVFEEMDSEPELLRSQPGMEWTGKF